MKGRGRLVPPRPGKLTFNPPPAPEPRGEGFKALGKQLLVAKVEADLEAEPLPTGWTATVVDHRNVDLDCLDDGWSAGVWPTEDGWACCPAFYIVDVPSLAAAVVAINEARFNPPPAPEPQGEVDPETERVRAAITQLRADAALAAHDAAPPAPEMLSEVDPWKHVQAIATNLREARHMETGERNLDRWADELTALAVLWFLVFAFGFFVYVLASVWLSDPPSARAAHGDGGGR